MRQTATSNGKSVALVKLDTERGVGCADTCRLVQYTDPTRLHSSVYETIMHDPAAHEEHGRMIGGQNASLDDVVVYQDLVIDLKRTVVSIGGKTLSGVNQPTPTEWKILLVLAGKPGRVITQKEILARVWGADYAHEAHLLRVNMARLRKKLNDSGERYISTRAGIGYAFAMDYTKEARSPYGVVEIEGTDCDTEAGDDAGE